ncbi:Aldo/keto reductase [Amniculicola lignicola CBS 123094]|uniref:Aldo/keto reductase n=1 Tax=Amniculicola lignicola CBS 123094 TaxID=1392246 RepID=A0A6A5VUV6_9PLEO|nr:Aldo/keto reductase [Amniculicola lignicola CBS 123094]
MSLFGELPKPKSLLEFHRVLSPTAGVRVSPLCLGGMNFGDAWESYMGKCDKKATFEMLDFFYDQGGNFIDTANNYQNEESETWIGEWMKERGNRDDIVLATKYTTCYPNPNTASRQRHNYAGNSTKSMHVSVEASLKKLGTTYIDLLYVHWWDFTTSVPEVMQSLNQLVSSGKVLYLGISDTPAWIVSKANEYARNHGLRPFSVYQGNWSAALRDFEREILPMTREEGMALAPWGALGGGAFTTEEKRKANDKGRASQPTEEQIKISKVLEALANKKNTAITSVALAYVMHKAPYVFPIVGGRNTKHLQGNIEALALELSDEEIDEIEAQSDFEVGFPMGFLFEFAGMGSKYTTRKGPSDIGLLKFAGLLDDVPSQRPVKPHGMPSS